MAEKKYHIITFGCQMNERDSETLAGFLEERGYHPVSSHGEADLVLLNTCSVRENADKRFFGTLGQLKRHKEQDPAFVVGVCGCMMQQPAIVAEIENKYPWVDLVFGTNNLHRFPELLGQLDLRASDAAGEGMPSGGSGGGDGAKADAAFAGGGHRGPLVEIWEEGGEIAEDLPAQRLHPHKAFVNIMFGCNNFCTYCIVPYTRGRERSRDPENILEEVRRLAADGVREVTLLGQNVNSYRGRDALGRGEKDFTDLLYDLQEVEGLERIRFMTSHPKDISERLIRAFGELPKLCKFIHLPVQSGNDEILRRMNRHYGREDYLDIVARLREAAPEICISTDIIVGFPGETEAQFADTLDLVERVGYDSAFTFLYSIRRGTPAAAYEEQVPEEVKHERFDRLVEAVNRHSLARNEAYLGREVEVLVEGESKRDPGMLSGRTEGFKLVNFRGDPAMIGHFCKIRITEAKTFSLVGRPASEE